MNTISTEGKEIFNGILIELARAFSLWVKDHSSYYQEVSSSNLIFTSIDAPIDLKNEILKRIKEGEPCIVQLFHTKESLKLTRDLCVVIRRCGNLNCLPTELFSIANDITYEYINSTLNDFYGMTEGDHHKPIIREACFESILSSRVTRFKKNFSATLYQFPVVVFGLDKETRLSDNALLKPIDHNELQQKELLLFNEARIYKSNFYLEINVKTKCSKDLSLQLAEKAKNATFNILKLFATRLSPDAIPLLTSDDRVKNPFHFYRYGPNNNSLSSATTRNFPNFQFQSKTFWNEFHQSQLVENSLIPIAFKIVELLLIPNLSSERVVDRFERALLWYGDAVTEYISFQQIQKIVSSLESLVNFHEDKVTENFKTRITNLNICYKGLDEKIKNKANQLYVARSNIVHGSSHYETFDFCIIDFSSETLLRAIYYFSIFGFDKKGFNKSLPKFLDAIPDNIEPRTSNNNP
ncbi:hypothetical protein [Pseudoalteromonas lipolytica]|uniref:hypothetical protein n=1 Tax=Pseudoalteromonas lipolytica TaxID=570156 RepID=UPI003A97E19A